MQRFLTAKEYNRMVDKRDGNCLSFAFGQTSQDFERFDLLSVEQIQKVINQQLMKKIDICDAFIKKAKEFGYDVEPISTIQGTEGKVVFIVFGWYTQPIEGVGKYDYFFHVIRKNENGSFEQKLDWCTRAKRMSLSKVNKYLRLDTEVHYFVLC